MKTLLLSILTLAVAALAACSSDEDPAPIARDLRVVHASLGTGPIELVFLGEEEGQETVIVSDVAYQQGTGRLGIVTDSAPVRIDVLGPAGATPLVDPVTIEFPVGEASTVLLLGDAGSAEALWFQSPRDAVAAGAVRLQFVHAVPALGGVDVYVTVPAADLSGARPIGSAGFRSVLPAMEFDAGAVQVRATTAGVPTEILFDSGTIELAEGDDLLVVATPSVAAGDIRLSLLAVEATDADGGRVLLDKDTPGELRLLHGLQDAPAVELSVDQMMVGEAVEFETTSDFLEVVPGERAVQIDALVPGGSQLLVPETAVNVATGQITTLLALGRFGSPQAVLVQAPRPQLVGDALRVHVVHGAPAVDEVVVYVTAPGADLSMSTPVGSLMFGGVAGPVEVPAADYQIRIALASDPTAPVFDSGTLTLEAGSDLIVSALTNVGPGTAPVELFVADGSPAPGGFVLRDVATPGRFRLVHASPDAPNVDLIVDNDFGNPELANVAFSEFSNYIEVAPDVYNLKLVEAGTSNVLIDVDRGFEAGESRSLHAVGLAASVSLLDLSDAPRRLGSEARLRLIHTSPSAGLVDLYVTTPGANITALAPDFTDLALGDETGYVGLAAGSYDVILTTAGTKNPVFGPETVSLVVGSIYTGLVRDAAGGGTPFQLIRMDDL